MIRIFVAVAALLAAGAAAAQDIDLGSEQNRVWWNGVTPNELRELAIEAGATYTFVSDNGGYVESRLEWPDIGVVKAGQGSCDWTSGPVDRDNNCTELLLVYEPTVDLEPFQASLPLWLSSGVGDDGVFRLYRYDLYVQGTTRGRVIGDLLIFRRDVGSALDLAY